MSKDYANKNRLNKRRKLHRESRFVPLAIAIFAVVCFLSAVVYTVRVYHQTTFFSNVSVASWFNHAKIMMSRKDKATAKTPSSQASAENEEIQFDFYTELPNMQVNLPQSAQLKTVSVPVHKSEEKMAGQIDQSIKTVMTQQLAKENKKQVGRFIVELGEFKDQLNASQLRLSLLLAGIETEIIKIADRQYRVQQGPYQSERQAKSAQRKLDRKGFESSIKEI